MAEAVRQAAEDLEKPGLNIAMPETILVKCPLVGGKMRVVIKHCTECEHFHGIGDRFPGDERLSMVERFHVRCAAVPVRRDLFEVA